MAENTNNAYPVSLDMVSGRRLEEHDALLWNAMKTWVLENVDKSNIMGIVKDYLDRANRQVIGTTGTEKAQAINVAVQAMVEAFEDSGLSMQGVTTADFARCIRSIATNTGCYIIDTNGLLWTASQWSYEKERQGHDPATKAGIYVMNPDHDFYVASKNYGTMMFGTYSHTIPNLEASSGGSAGTPKDGEYNSRKIMAATNPDHVRDEYKITYFDGMDMEDLEDKDIVFFPDRATMVSWGNTMGLTKMLLIGTTMIYAYPHATDTGKYVLEYHKDGVTAVTFAVREAVAPYVDTYAQVGCTALEACYVHKENDVDETFWRLGTLFEPLLMYLNKYAINECRIALGEDVLPSGYVWCCLQSSNYGEYCFSLADGSYNGSSKNFKYWVVPIASEIKVLGSAL